jgi:hypothetical protein
MAKLSAAGATLSAMTIDEQALRPLLNRQRGLLSRQQARACGLTDDSLRHRARPGGPWQRLQAGVYMTVTGEPTPEQREIAALLYAGPRSVLTGAAALRQHELRTSATAAVDVLVPVSCKRPDRGYIAVHRTRQMPTVVAVRGALRYTLPARAVADTVRGQRRLSDARAVVGGVVQRRLCTVAELAAELELRPGRGTALLREVLAEVADGIRSAPEGDLREVVRASALPRPLYNPRLYLNGQFLAEPDAWWEEASVLGEVDSREWHLSPENWESTMRRHDRLAAAGLTVLHFSPKQIRTEPGEVVQLITAALRAGRPATQIVTKPAAG